MSTGPIEFIRSTPVDDLGSTEYGGDPGLVAGGDPGGAVGLSGRGVDHLAHLKTSERLGIAHRAKSSAHDEVSVDEDGVVNVQQVLVNDGIDPVTGLTVDDADIEDGAPGVPATDFVGGPNA